MAASSLKDAAEEYKKNPSADNYQRLMIARNATATALGQRRNIKGEPSGEIVDNALGDLPAPLSPSTILKKGAGGDPLDAALREIDKQYNLGLYPKESKDSKGQSPSKGSVFDKYPNLMRPPQ